jgi:hypothetical protein
VAAFVEASRQVLKENQPVSVDYLGSVMSLRLQDSTILPIVYIPEGEVPQMGDSGPAVHITSPKTTQSGIAPSRAWGVTGK